MYAVKAIYDGVGFTAQQPIPVKGLHEVIITFLEPVQETKRMPRFLNAPDPSKSDALGMWDGEASIPDDFNEPLDDLKEYMY